MYTLFSKQIRSLLVVIVAIFLFVAAAPAANAQSSTRTVTIKSTGSATIYDVHIVPSTSQIWGSDKLSFGETIAPGQQKKFSLTYGSTYDLLVEDAQGRDIAQVNNVYMSENKVWTIDEVALVVENNSSESICYMYISPWNSNTYGSNRLTDDEVIRANEQRTFYVNPGSYDLLAHDCDYDRMASTDNVNLYTAKTWTVGQSTIDLTIINLSDRSICNVYIALATDESWGPDRLGSTELIRDGWQRTFTLAADVYNLRVRPCYSDTYITRFNVTLDEDTDWTLYE